MPVSRRFTNPVFIYAITGSGANIATRTIDGKRKKKNTKSKKRKIKSKKKKSKKKYLY